MKTGLSICSWESAAGKLWLGKCPSGKRKYCSPSGVVLSPWGYQRQVVLKKNPPISGLHSANPCCWTVNCLCKYQRKMIRCVFLMGTVAETVVCAPLLPLTPRRTAEAHLPAFPAGRWGQGSDRCSKDCRWKQYTLSGLVPKTNLVIPALPLLVFQIDEEDAEEWT